MNQINVDKWAKKDLWTLWEGIFLLLGKEPELSSFFKCQNNEVFRSEFSIIFNELGEIVKSAIHRKLLKIHRRAPNFFFNQINPSIFLKWAETKFTLNEQLQNILLQLNEIEDNLELHKHNSLSPKKNNVQNQKKIKRNPPPWQIKVKEIFEQDKSLTNQKVWEKLKELADNGDDTIIEVKSLSSKNIHFVRKSHSTKKEIKVKQKTFQNFMSNLRK